MNENKLILQTKHTKIEMEISESSVMGSELDGWIESLVRGLEAITYHKQTIYRAIDEYIEYEKQEGNYKEEQTDLQL